VVFSFSLNSRNFLVSSLASSLTHWLLSNMLCNLQYLHIFYCCFCCWVLVLLHCDQIVRRGLLQFSYICWNLLCALTYGLLWTKFYALLRRMCIVLLQDGIFCRHLSGPLDLWYHGFLGFFFLLTFCLDDLSFGDNGWLKSPTTTVLGFICDFKYLSVCLMKLGALTLGHICF
jgi:hypothetical protein